MKKILYKKIDENQKIELFEEMKKRFEKYEKFNFNEEEFMDRFSNSEGTKFNYEGKNYDIRGEIFQQTEILFDYIIESKEIRNQNSYILYIVEDDEEERYYIWRNFKDKDKDLGEWKVIKRKQIFSSLNEEELEEFLMEIDVENFIDEGGNDLDDFFDESELENNCPWIYTKIVPIK